MESAFGVVSLPQRSDLECEKSPLDGFLSLALNKPMMDCSGTMMAFKKKHLHKGHTSLSGMAFQGGGTPPLRFP